MKLHPRSSLALFIASCALLLGGCATGSQSAAMVATVTTPLNKSPRSVNVTVTGGSETSSLGASKISNADFASAIETSIAKSGLFAKIAGRDAADYALSVQIVRLDQPFFGASFTVTIETTWRLVRRADGGVVWEKAVVTPYTATMGDALVGSTRLRLANEGAARANIESAIKQLGTLQLP